METILNEKHQVAKQIEMAFDFVQKLYQESAYLIKEIEGKLAEHEYHFMIIKPSGYGVNSRSSNSLDPTGINFWLMRKFAFAFVTENQTATQGSKTNTEITDKLKVMYFRIILNDKKIKEPKLLFGTFYEIKALKEGGWITKFENLMSQFEYLDDKLFKNTPNVDFENSDFRLKGIFKEAHLLDINSSEELVSKVINPAIKIFDGIIV
jgi:hypothetical protein